MTLQNEPFYFLKYIPWNGSIYSGDKKKDISLEMKKWTRMTENKKGALYTNV